MKLGEPDQRLAAAVQTGELLGNITWCGLVLSSIRNRACGLQMDVRLETEEPRELVTLVRFIKSAD
jgi:hypothetical protein